MAVFLIRAIFLRRKQILELQESQKRREKMAG